MNLVGVGFGTDSVVTDSVAIVKKSTNLPYSELLKDYTVSLAELAEFFRVEPYSSVVFISHGGATALADATSSKAAYFVGDDHSLLEGKYVFAHACNSALHLGRDAVKSAVIYFGFDSTINGPIDGSSACYQDLCTIYSKMIYFIANVASIHLQDLADFCQNFLDELKALCVQTQENFDVPGGSTLDAEELIVISQFARSSSIWITRHPAMLKATGQSVGFSLW